MKQLLKLSRRTMLHFFLGYAALGWGICVAGIFAPSKATFELLGYVGGIDPGPLLADPMYDYWLRMASSVFTFIGVAYLLLAIWPKKYAVVLPFAGVFMLAEGLILLIHGLRLHLPDTPFSGDTSFCFIGGIGLLFSMGSVRGKGKIAPEILPPATTDKQ